MLYPERIKASASGGCLPGVGVPPVGEWNGQELRYFQTGLEDIDDMAGKPFDLNEYAQVPQFIYVGDQDSNYTTCPECFAED